MTSLLAAPAAALVRLTDEAPAAEDVTPGWIYTVVFFSLVAVVVLLWLSMRKQLKKIHFDEPDDSTGDDRQEPAP